MTMHAFMALSLLALAGLLARGNAECPNACSGHGNCGNYDQCNCWRSFQGEDCSVRLCPFGRAHVDIPKGDLDGSHSYEKRTTVVGSIVWPLGTQELYPNFTDSRGNDVPQMAHDYAECSNKGMCNGKTGMCECFPGYDGTACQRASCPNDCSGHGTCRTIKDIAYYNSGTTYSLWDAEVSMGCVCDPGYSGSDCADHDCPKGMDPLYVDSEVTARVESTAYRLTTTEGDLYGTYALKFYDVFGDDFKTKPILTDATCADVVSALEALPNTVIPEDSTVCSSTVTSSTSTYRLTFTGNPGYMKQLFVDAYLDGDRETVMSTALDDDTLVTDPVQTVDVWTTGMAGEDVDYFGHHCRGVLARIGGSALVTNAAYTSGNTYVNAMNSGYYLDSLTKDEVKALKICLGDADGITSNNVEVYNWDYGSVASAGTPRYGMDSSPHAIKLVKKNPNDDFDGGMYYLTWWSGSSSSVGSGDKFILANPPSTNADLDWDYYVYTTDGYVERLVVDRDYDGEMDFAEPAVTAWWEQYSNVVYTAVDTSCLNDQLRVDPCIEQGDLVYVIDSAFLNTTFNATRDGATVALPQSTSDESGNLYKVTRVYVAPPTLTTPTIEDRYRIVLDKNIPVKGDTTTNSFASPLFNTSRVGVANVFKFTPATTGNFEFVSQCANRGTCDSEYGECHCYNGYTAVDCSIQDALAVAK